MKKNDTLAKLQSTKAANVNKGNKGKNDEKEVTKLKASNREMQLKLTDLLNKNAQLETLNARTMLQNKNLSEIAKKSPANAAEPIEVDSEVKITETKTKPKEPQLKQKKSKCRFFERDCRKGGDECPFIHPSSVCVVFSRLGEGACPDGNACIKSHPI